MMELMFEKSLTPSDVGKLNRLVIPKQYAVRYFPAEAVEKGLLLEFEDEEGKLWKFRYSYWSSSKSYVLTKGWSRFVREKRLDAGDVVSFQRRGGEYFIRWRRVAQVVGGGESVSQSRSGSAGGSGVSYTGNHQDAQPDIQDPAKSKERQVRLFGVNLAA